MKTTFAILLSGLCLFACTLLPSQTASPSPTPSTPAELRQQHIGGKFKFIAYGDTRFTVAPDPVVSNGPVRRELVSAIAHVHPAFIVMSGDIVYNGSDPADWQDFDRETHLWRDEHIPVYPALGNHEVRGGEQPGLSNYFQRFPELNESRYYSARAGNILFIVLDSNLDVSSGPQTEWLNSRLDTLPASVDFVVFLMHHPPVTTAIDNKDPDHKPEIRFPERTLAQRLEDRQRTTRARFIVIAGHVHNYERHHRNGVTYFVSGGGGANAHVIARDPAEPYPDNRINYHYLLFEVNGRNLKVTMNRLEMVDGKPQWTQPDSVSIESPKTLAKVPAAAIPAPLSK